MYTVIYGINETTTLFLNSRFNKGSNIFACTKGGESYQGEPSLSLEQLVKMNRNEIDRVVICSEFVAEISANLINNGFTLEQLYFFDYHKKIPVPLTDISLSSVSKNNTLYAFYDLSFNLPCYDVTVFCVLAELKRKSLGLDHIHFVVVPSRSEQGGHLGSATYFSSVDYQWRIDKILRGNFECIPSCAGISVLPLREDAQPLTKNKHLFPADYTLEYRDKTLATSDLPRTRVTNHDFCSFSAPSNATVLVNNFVQRLLKGRKLITLTLREYAYSPERNSNLKEWAKFLATLNNQEYLIVVIRDTYHSFDKEPEEFADLDVHYMPAASLDFALRVAFYQTAFVNFSVNNGPTLVLNFIKDCRYINFIWTNEKNPAISPSLFKKLGIPIGEQYWFRQNELQHLVWENDSFEAIDQAFEHFLTLHEKHYLSSNEANHVSE
ncbi:hypothetical protein BIW53_08105 [Pseudoalteromonas byunsanensis]|uniref:Uncharacterized protein n=2 Tax=Pseudoalteromonas byunsanensis TaxID=327939 RepID=A0A1S1N8M6_9GAMM|nr:hypothetical protein BIW53_08105 [Pseudoalteromonas byunsanensis]